MLAERHMAERRVPAWFTAVGNTTAAESLYELFREVVLNLPMSSTELAREIGVSQPTVSRWAHDTAHPSLDEMALTLEIITRRLRETEATIARAATCVMLALEAVTLQKLAALDPESAGQSLVCGSRR